MPGSIVYVAANTVLCTRRCLISCSPEAQHFRFSLLVCKMDILASVLQNSFKNKIKAVMHSLAGLEKQGRTVKSQCCHQPNTQGTFSNGAAFFTLHSPSTLGALQIPRLPHRGQKIPAPRAAAQESRLKLCSCFYS